MEVHTINQGKLEKTKHKKSIIFSTIFGLIGLICLFNSVYLFLNLTPILNYVLSPLFLIFSIFFAIFTPITTKKFLEKEKLEYNNKNNELVNNIEYCCNLAKNSLEVNYEENDN